MSKSIKSFVLLIGFISFIVAQNPIILSEQGYEKLEAEQYQEAQTLFKQVLDIDPSYAPAMVGLSRITLRNGDMAKTRELLRQAIDNDPKNQSYRDEFERVNEINTLMSQGLRALNSGDFEEAFDSYAVVLEKFPFFAEAAYSMGLVKFREKDYDAAVIQFKKALDLNPYHENALAAIANVARNAFNKGNQAYRRRDLDAAITNYRHVIEIDTSFYHPFWILSHRSGNRPDKKKYQSRLHDGS